MLLVSICVAIIFFSLSECKMELVFVHALWRHGERTPAHTFPKDQYNASDWVEGGGGYGQLTTRGMESHYRLGLKLREMYIDRQPFLSKHYKTEEIYIRSTDFDRTIKSATANTLGMFSHAGTPGVDFPNITGWPSNYAPVPVHTVKRPDPVGFPEHDCPRIFDLFQLVLQSKDFQNFWNETAVQDAREVLEAETGADVGPKKLYSVVDDLMNQQTVLGANFTESYPWLQELSAPYNYSVLRYLSDQLLNYHIGMGTKEIVCGVDIAKEIKTVRGGPLIKSITDMLRAKHRFVAGEEMSKEDKEQLNMYRKLKFYGFSGHDMTQTALLSVLDINLERDRIVTIRDDETNIRPRYASAILTELYEDEKKRPYFKLSFMDAANGYIPVPLNAFLKGCKKNVDYCPLEVLEQLAHQYDAGDIEKLCVKSATCGGTTTTTAKTRASRITTSSSVSFTLFQIIATLVASILLFL